MVLWRRLCRSKGYAMKQKILVGQTFGKLTVVKDGPAYISPSGQRQERWWCSCACGRLSKLVIKGNLTNGSTKSCGCLAGVGVKHGHSSGGRQSHTYKTWASMKERCTNPCHDAFVRYGGRGIGVCQRWQDSFEAFLEDMGPRPAGHTLDRIDNTKGYSKDNCRWATQRQQQNNRRNNRLVTVSGVEDTLANHCRRYGVKPHVMRYRLKNGWTAEEAVTIPVGRRKEWYRD